MTGLFNFGWFTNALAVEIKLNSARKTKCLSLLFQEVCTLFSSQELLSGKIVLMPPNGTKVWHNGVTLTLDFTLSFFETLSTEERPIVEIKIAEPGYVEGVIELPFEIDLLTIADQYLGSYDGEMFFVRHSLLVTVLRPWYTFDVLQSTVVVVHKLEQAPEVEDHVIDDDITLRSQFMKSEGEEASIETVAKFGPHCMRVVDAQQGLCFRYKRSCLNLGDCLRGTIILGDNNSMFLQGHIDNNQICKDVATLELMLYKVESGDDNSNEVVIAVQKINVLETADPNTGRNAGIDAGESTGAEAGNAENSVSVGASNVDIANPLAPPQTSITVSETRMFPVEMSLAVNVSGSDIELTPTLIDDLCSVRYYIRLLATDTTGHSAWTTHELVLYRANLHHELI